jgi:hypothetical protein
MLTLVAELTPLVLGALFVWWGGGGLLSKMETRRVAASVLNHLIRDVRLTTLAMRTAAIVTWAVGVGLLVAPTADQPAVGSALIGIGLLTYVGYAMVTELEPATWRTFVTAGLVGAGGLLATEANNPWWSAIAERPVTATAVLALTAAVLVGLSLYPRPRRRLRIAAVPGADLRVVDSDRLHKLAG